MASPHQIREMTHAQPSRAFTMHLVDGPNYLVGHHDFLRVSPNMRHWDLTIHDEDGPHLIDLNLVVELQPVPDWAQVSP
jgi:hypothetical protein